MSHHGCSIFYQPTIVRTTTHDLYTQLGLQIPRHAVLPGILFLTTRITRPPSNHVWLLPLGCCFAAKRADPVNRHQQESAVQAFSVMSSPHAIASNRLARWDGLTISFSFSFCSGVNVRRLSGHGFMIHLYTNVWSAIPAKPSTKPGTTLAY